MILKCSSCEEDKDSSEFSKKTKCSRGFSYKCKTCHNKYVKDVWYVKNAQKQKDSSAKWKQENKEQVLATAYKISLEELKTLQLVESCEICGKVAKLVIDHDHTTGKVRGMLCTNCNTTLGKAGDDLESIIKFVSYLKR